MNSQSTRMLNVSYGMGYVMNCRVFDWVVSLEKISLEYAFVLYSHIIFIVLGIHIG